MTNESRFTTTESQASPIETKQTMLREQLINSVLHAVRSYIEQFNLPDTPEEELQLPNPAAIRLIVRNYLANCSFNELTLIKDITLSEITDHIGLRLAANEQNQIEFWQTAASQIIDTTNRTINSRAMEQFVNVNESLIPDDPSAYLNKAGRTLHGAALTARKAKLIRQNLFEAATSDPNPTRTKEKPPTYYELAYKQLQETHVALALNNITQINEQAPELKEEMPAIRSRLWGFVKQHPRFSGALVAATVVTGMLAGNPQIREGLKSLTSLTKTVEAAGNYEETRELDTDELANLGITTGTITPEITNDIPPIETLSGVDPKLNLNTPTETRNWEVISIPIEQQPNKTTTEIVAQNSQTENAVEPVAKSELISETEEANAPSKTERPATAEALSRLVKNKRAQREQTDPTYTERIDPELNKDRVNLFIMGLDKSEKRADWSVFRADAIIVLSYDLASNQVTMFRIPRDTHAPEVDDYSKKWAGKQAFRINAVTAMTNFENSRKVIEDATGLSGDIMTVVDFDGVRKLVDATGGVDIELDQDFVNRYGAKLAADNVIITPGINHFDGRAALQFARVRKLDSDHERGVRQQEAMTAILKQVLKNARQDPGSLLRLISEAKTMSDEGQVGMAGEISFTDLLSLATAVSIDHIKGNSLTTPEITITPESFWRDELLQGGVIPGDAYQLVVRGQKPDDNLFLRYWAPVRDAIKTKLGARVQVVKN